MRCIFGQNEAWGLFMMERIRRSGAEAAQLWERNQHYALNIVLSGSGRIKYEGGLSQRLSAGSAYQHFPEDRAGQAALDWDSDEVEERFLLLDQRSYDRIAALGLFPHWRVRQLNAVDALCEWIDSQVESGFTQSGHGQLVRGGRNVGKVVSFLAELFDRIEGAVSASASASVVEQFLHRLELNAGERLTLPEIAEQLGVGYATMRRQVLQATGVSPARCRIEMRIRKARQLLLSHDVQTTAYRLGYTDPFVFSKQFKEATGYAPSTYRQSFSE